MFLTPERIKDEEILRGLLNLEYPDSKEKQETYMQQVRAVWALEDFVRKLTII